MLDQTRFEVASACYYKVRSRVRSIDKELERQTKTAYRKASITKDGEYLKSEYYVGSNVYMTNDEHKSVYAHDDMTNNHRHQDKSIWTNNPRYN